MQIRCDYCGKDIVGVATNVGDSIEVLLACSECVAKMNGGN